MYINTKGLVLRSVTYKDSSRILTVLTSTDGKVTVSARGAMRRGSKLAAAVQPLAFSDMTLYHSRDRWTLTEAQTIELFGGLSEDVALFALGGYVAELLEAVSDEDSPNPDVLSLGLNTLYALASGKKDPALVKAAFELRLMSLAGYEPAAFACEHCGKTDMPDPMLDLVGGAVCCRSCAIGDGETTLPLCPTSLDALRHVLSADPKRIFSFSLPYEQLARLGKAAERFVAAQLDRGFKTLDYYKQMKI